MVGELVWAMFVAGAATFAFSVHLSMPPNQIVYGAITGGISWGIYSLLYPRFTPMLVGLFFAAFFVSIFSRILSRYRQCPQTLFLLSGIFVLAPGSTIYNAALQAICQNMQGFISNIFLTLLIAGTIASAIAISTLIPLPKRKK